MSQERFTPKFTRYAPQGRNANGVWYDANEVDPIIAELYAALDDLLQTAKAYFPHKDSSGSCMRAIAALSKARGEA